MGAAKERYENFEKAMKEVSKRLGIKVEVSIDGGDEDSAEYDVVCKFPGLGYEYCVTIGCPVEVKSIRRKVLSPGYRVYYWLTSLGTRHSPPDIEDITVVETVYESMAVQKLFMDAVAQEVCGYYDGQQGLEYDANENVA